MINRLLKKIFSTSNDRTLKSIYPLVTQINASEEGVSKLSDEQLKSKTFEFKARIANGASLDNILVEAFAVVREASKRVLKMRHFDVQLIGGIVLHKGMIAEMKTGEGKTLIAPLAAYLNALSGKGVHVVTVNDYLAKRDAQWMGQLYNFLGLSVGCVLSNIDETQRKEAYGCDITYGTNNEFGFDYLRDNLKYDFTKMVQPPFNYAIIDEVDSILIDEARTPLIISGPTKDTSELYTKINSVMLKLSAADYDVDEKTQNVTLTEQGHDKIEDLLRSKKLIEPSSNLYNIENIALVHHINQALKAHTLFKRDNHYIVKDNKVLIIDEFTGRIMDGRRYSEGLHQAIEAKENVAIQNENQTLASITFQNYFRMYPKIAGMTGTAITEATEFSDIYSLEVVTIPTHLPVKRVDEDDEIYLTEAEKYNAIVAEIEKVHKLNQPILVGTTSIQKSENLSKLLKKKNIKHTILNARYHEREAYIIAQAGRAGMVTIATNMAGRGTDIMLGGNPHMLAQEAATEDLHEITKIHEEVKKNKEKVLQAGGLYVLGTERHESRRIDNQLRGRAGRQGDPGRTKFYLSMEDELMRIFVSDKVTSLLSKLGLKNGEAIMHPWISRSIEKAQQKVEARNYDIRKTLLKFDDVVNKQRKVVYEQRKYIASGVNLDELIYELIGEIIDNILQYTENELNTEKLKVELYRYFKLEDVDLEKVSDLKEFIIAKAMEQMKDKKHDQSLFVDAVKYIMLMTLDTLWKEHLHTLDYLRTGIGLRAYGQKDPLNEYKMEAFKFFREMMEEFAHIVVEHIFHMEIVRKVDVFSGKTYETRSQPNMLDVTIHEVKPIIQPNERDPYNEETWGKLSRNESCPCNSGKKYKYCHGRKTF